MARPDIKTLTAARGHLIVSELPTAVVAIPELTDGESSVQCLEEPPRTHLKDSPPPALTASCAPPAGRSG